MGLRQILRSPIQKIDRLAYCSDPQEVCCVHIRALENWFKKKKFEVKQMINLLQIKRMKKSPKTPRGKKRELWGRESGPDSLPQLTMAFM